MKFHLPQASSPPVQQSLRQSVLHPSACLHVATKIRGDLGLKELAHCWSSCLLLLYTPGPIARGFLGFSHCFKTLPLELSPLAQLFLALALKQVYFDFFLFSQCLAEKPFLICLLSEVFYPLTVPLSFFYSQKLLISAPNSIPLPREREPAFTLSIYTSTARLFERRDLVGPTSSWFFHGDWPGQLTSIDLVSGEKSFRQAMVPCIPEVITPELICI